MVMMENAEEVQQALERFTKLKQTQIPSELEDYLCFVAKSGDTIFRWQVIKALFREKLIAVIKQFHEQTAIDDLPHYPNVDPFNYETMKTALLERLDSFSAAPFTVQRICELLTDPRKQYSRIDKFMRAIEKNILVVSTTEPGRPKSTDSDYSDSLDSMVNGSSNVTGGALGDDLAGDIDVDIELENGSAAIAGESEQASPAAAAPLPSINTLNSAIMAANQGGAQTSEHLGQQGNDDEEEDDDDDEDVVRNHLTTEEEASIETAAAAAASAAVPPTTDDADEEKKGQKRPEEEEEDSDSAKRLKVGQELTENADKPSTEGEEPVKETDAEPKVDATEVDKALVAEEKPEEVEAAAAVTCETAETETAKDEPTPVAEEAVPMITPEANIAEKAAPVTETVAEGEQKVAESVPEPIDTATATTSDVLPPAEPIVADVAEKEAEPVQEEEEEAMMDDKPIETVDAMEAEATPIPASEMDVDSSEGTTSGPAIISEESVSMDEPMEDQ